MTADAKGLTGRASHSKGRPIRDKVPANSLRVMAKAFERLGYDCGGLLAKAGVRRRDIENPDAAIACEAVGAMVAAAIEQRPMANIAARLAVETPIGEFPVVDYLVLTSENVGEGLKQLARYLRLEGAPYHPAAHEDEDPVRVLFENAPNAFVVEFGVVLTVLHLREETEGRLRIASASFRHRPDDPAEIERILGCPIRTGAPWDGFALSREAWMLPLRRRDAVLRGILERHAAEIAAPGSPGAPVESEVRRVLTSRLATGSTQIQSVARELGTSARSLQRRLAGAGWSYRELLDATRREAAGRYLENRRLSLGEVAYLLGYSEPAAFHRAFKRWNGRTPRSVRAREE